MKRFFSPTGVFTSERTGPAVVIGAASIDTVGRLKDDLRTETSNQALIRTGRGGVARNVAENLARLGQEVHLITAVGHDQAGERLVAGLKNAGVNVDAILRTPDYPTNAYLAVINPNGGLALALDDMRAIKALTPAYLRQHERLIAQAGVVFVDANLSKTSLRAIMSITRRNGIPVAADPTARGLAERLVDYLPNLMMVTPNSGEAAVLTGEPFEPASRSAAITAAKRLVERGVGLAIVAQAEYGVCYATSQVSGQIPALRTRVQDPTGAGDALTATVIFALLNQIAIDDAVRLGVTAASLTLASPGSVAVDLSLEKLYDKLVI